MGCIYITSEEFTVSECKNYGIVEAENSSMAGGIVGNVQKTNRVCVNNCYNYGTIMAGNSYAGGIIGVIQSKAELNGCGNTGTITANKQAAGGMVGRMGAGSIKNCYNTGNIEAKSTGVKGISGGIVGVFNTGIISNVYNSGTVKVVNGTASTNDTAGGIVGLYKAGSVTNAYNKGELVGGETEGEIRTGGILGEKTDGDISSTFYYTTNTGLNGIGISNTDQTGTKKVTNIINSLNEFLDNIKNL